MVLQGVTRGTISWPVFALITEDPDCTTRYLLRVRGLLGVDLCAELAAISGLTMNIECTDDCVIPISSSESRRGRERQPIFFNQSIHSQRTSGNVFDSLSQIKIIIFSRFHMQMQSEALPSTSLSNHYFTIFVWLC